MYVFCDNLLFQSSSFCLLFGASMIILSLAVVPLATQVYEYHPLWTTCLLISDAKQNPSHLFLFLYFVIIINSLLVDGISYGRILNYMRKNSVRVTVIATTRSERIKSHNIVTASSSLLIWMVSVVSIMPTSLMLIKSGPALDANHILTLIHYQEVLTLIFGTVMPLMYIGSSAELRKDATLLKKIITMIPYGRQQQRADVYTIEPHAASMNMVGESTC